MQQQGKEEILTNHCDTSMSENGDDYDNVRDSLEQIKTNNRNDRDTSKSENVDDYDNVRGSHEWDIHLLVMANMGSILHQVCFFSLLHLVIFMSFVNFFGSIFRSYNCHFFCMLSHFSYLFE